MTQWRSIRVAGLAGIVLLATASFAGAQEKPSGEGKSEAAPETTNQSRGPSLPAIAVFDPRADPAYGAFQRGEYLTAFDLALKRASAGDAASQTLIAEIYDKGLGIPRDGKEAAAWYGIAARSGDAQAQFAYAMKLLTGRDIEKNPQEARVFMEKAADAGIAAAQFNLGQMMLEEKPGLAGFQDALPLFRKAANAGVPDASYALAQAYGEGVGVERDEVQARAFMMKAARAGLRAAQI